MSAWEPANAIMVLLVCSAIGLNLLFWGSVGALRFAVSSVRGLLGLRRRPASAVFFGITPRRVAVIIPAHNEEVALPNCIRALIRILPPSQIFVASDGSSDRTVAIAREMGCWVCDIQPNSGKARAIQFALRKYRLIERFAVVLIQDADSEIDPDYLKWGLPLFDDPEVVTVAGHVRSRWPAGRRLRFGAIFSAYRTRLYGLVQAAFQYGQTWRWISVSYIAPGFCSMYRTSVLRSIDIAAPGLLIEDFNMTFEVQHKRLGKIAYTPKAMCSTEDPFRFGDYRRQCLRWYIGFWQTVRRHGIWPSRFCLSLGIMVIELLLFSVVQTLLPLLVVAEIAAWLGLLPNEVLESLPLRPAALLMLFLAVDYALTLVTAFAERRASLLIYGLVFPFLRFLEALLFLAAIPKALLMKSDGRWTSPSRRRDAQLPRATSMPSATV